MAAPGRPAPLSWAPRKSHGQSGVALGATRSTRAASGGAAGPGMWDARPLAEPSPAGRRGAHLSALSPLPHWSFASHSPAPAPRPPGWKPSWGGGGWSGDEGEWSSP